MDNSRRFIYLLLCSLTLFIYSCKPGVPNKYVQPSQMVDILYEYHLADAIVSISQGGDSLAMRAYQASILEKYDVTQQNLDSSMVYYCRHTGLLEDVYRRVADRIDNESLAQGMNGSNGYGDVSLGGDTANVWKGERAIVLSPSPAVNCYSYEIKPDTSYHKGDAFALDFDAQFLYQDGMRRAVAVMAVYYEGDSVATAFSQMSSSSHYSSQISNEGHLKVKRIKVFWLMSEDKTSESSNTLKIMIASNIRLIRMHKSSEKSLASDELTPNTELSQDSLIEEKDNGVIDEKAVLLPRRRKNR